MFFLDTNKVFDTDNRSVRELESNTIGLTRPAWRRQAHSPPVPEHMSSDILAAKLYRLASILMAYIILNLG